MVPVLTKAVQELNEKNESSVGSLQSTIDSQSAKIEKLEKENASLQAQIDELKALINKITF